MRGLAQFVIRAGVRHSDRRKRIKLMAGSASNCQSRPARRSGHLVACCAPRPARSRPLPTRCGCSRTAEEEPCPPRCSGCPPAFPAGVSSGLQVPRGTPWAALGAEAERSAARPTSRSWKRRLQTSGFLSWRRDDIWPVGGQMGHGGARAEAAAAPAGAPGFLSTRIVHKQSRRRPEATHSEAENESSPWPRPCRR